MRSTKPSADPPGSDVRQRAWRLAPAAAVKIAAALLTLLAALGSCTSVEELRDPPAANGPDGGAEDGGDAGFVEGGGDAPSPAFDAGPPRTVSCTVAPCAVALSSFSRVVTDVGPGGGLVDLTLGAFCALLDSGRVVCWGTNRRGELGRAVSKSDKPGFVAGIEDAKELSGTCVVLADQSVRCWGEGAFLQDGGAVTVHTEPVTLPIPPAKKVAVGKQINGAAEDFGCAVLASDELSCWGYAAETNQSYLSRVDAAATSYAGREPRIVPLPGGAVPVDVAVDCTPSATEVSFVRLADGTVSSWGDQRFLGRATSLLLDPYPTPIELGGVSALDVVSENVCAVAGGRVYCWGHATENILGKGAPKRALPEAVMVSEPMVQISTAREKVGSSYQRACSVARSGRVYCWGENDRGQAGDGTRAFASTPVAVEGLPEPAVSVRVLPRSTCALLESGKVFCWGDGEGDALGQSEPRTFSVRPLEVTLP